MKSASILITGTGGFIGFNLAQHLLKNHFSVVGIDNFNHAYNPVFKRENVQNLKKNPHFVFYQTDIFNQKKVQAVFENHHIERVIHLAARTGVRKSLLYPKLYEKTNIEGTGFLYECAGIFGCKQFIFASSSSVYGNAKTVPFKENQKKLSPTSPYARSKKNAEEVLALHHTRYKIPTTVLRFFSVYGPSGRPDMAPYIFTQKAFTRKPVFQYGNGETARDYTYIDDIIKGIYLALKKPFDFEIINLGNNHPIQLQKLIEVIEKYTGQSIKRTVLPRRKEESLQTWADITKAQMLLGWKPVISFEAGMKKFIKWYKKNRI